LHQIGQIVGRFSHFHEIADITFDADKVAGRVAVFYFVDVEGCCSLVIAE